MADREAILVDVVRVIVDWLVEHSEPEESPLSNEQTDRPKEEREFEWR